MSKTYSTSDYVGSDNTFGDDMAPGTYTFEFQVSTGGSDPSLNPTFTVDQVLVDPCASATLTVPSNADITMTLTQAAFTEDLDAPWAVTPSFCRFTVTTEFDIRLINEGLMSVTLNPVTQQLAFSQVDNLSLLDGQLQKTYPITFNGKAWSLYVDGSVDANLSD